jgi:hypothetical protein
MIICGLLYLTKALELFWEQRSDHAQNNFVLLQNSAAASIRTEGFCSQFLVCVCVCVCAVCVLCGCWCVCVLCACVCVWLAPPVLLSVCAQLFCAFLELSTFMFVGARTRVAELQAFFIAGE